MVSGLFCELNLKNPEDARLHRNKRISDLQAQGAVCTAENLYHVDGKRVHLLTAEVVSTQRQKGEDNIPPLKDANSRPAYSRYKFETR